MFPRRLIPLITCLGALAGPLAAQAQTTAPAPAQTAAPAVVPARHGGHRHHNRFYRALRTINLTDAQRTQISALRAQTKTANTNADPVTRKANEAKLQQQIRALLTPDQQTQLTAALQHHGPAPDPNMPAAPVPPNPAATPAH